MKIYAIYPTIGIDSCKSTLWRCIAPDPDPKRISALVGRNDREKAAIVNRLSKRNYARGSIRSRLIWMADGRKTRYSDGTVPVIYFAEDPKTATIERFLWGYRDLGDTSLLGDFSLNLLVFSVKFSGSFRDLTPHTPPCNQLVHSSDYDCCQKISKIAYVEGTQDALRVRSARSIIGVNWPIFRGGELDDVLEVIGVTVFVRSGRKEAIVNGTAFSVEAEDVFAQF